MIYYKTPSGEVFAYANEAERIMFGSPDLVPMTDAQVQAHLNPLPPPRNVAAEIHALEQTTLMPRPVRDYMLEDMENRAAAAGEQQGLTRAQSIAVLRSRNAGYRRVKELDEQIAALRALL
jgi:hypothetical protein